MTTKSSLKDQNLSRRQKLYSVGFSRSQLIPVNKSEFDVWKLIKRNNGESAYCLALKYRSKLYTNAPRRLRTGTPGHTIHRRRKNTDSAMTTDSDGRSSALSTATENLDGEPYLKDNYDYDAEDPVEPPRYPHLVHVPGTYCQELYLKSCKHLGIIRSSMFYKQLTKDVINIRRQHIGPLGMKACAMALVETLNIHTLDLTDNCLETKGAEYLAELLLENNFIKRLILSDNNLGYDGVYHLAGVLPRTDNLTVLNLSGNGLGDSQIEAVRPIIEDTTNLKTLDLSHNGFGENGGRILAEALSRTDTLQNLDISWNHLRRKGFMKIAEMLAKNSSLQYLNISWNAAHTTGCSAFGKALEKNNTLTKLDISNNRINGKGLERLISGLRKNTALKTIRVGQNPLNQDDALAMVTFIQKTPASGLCVVDMKDVSVEEKFVGVLKDIRADREITFIHGNVLGSSLGIQDLDEGSLLVYDSETVIKQLGSILGIDIYKILNVVVDERKSNLTPEQTCKVFDMLRNPLSTKCTDILVKRLPRDSKGNIDLRKIVENQHAVDRHRKHSPLKCDSKKSRDPDNDDFDECDPVETEEERIRGHIYKVLTRKLASSTKYRRDLETMSQDGEMYLTQFVIEHLENVD